MQSGETHDDELGGDRRCGEAMPLLQLPKDIYKAAPDDEHSAPRPLSTTHKIIRVMFITLMNLAMGAVNEAAGPVIPELIVQTSTSYEQIMTAISMRGGGHVIGGILVMVTLLGFWYRLRVFSMRYLDMLDSQISCDWGVQYMSEKPYLEAGFLVDRLFRHIDMFSLVCTVLYTSVSIFAIYVRDIVLMSTAFLVQGVLVTVIDIVALRVILTAYKESSATPCLVWHIGYCVGGLLGPLTVEPFVDSRFSGLRHNHGGNVNLTAMIESHNGTANHIIYQYPGKFVTAYWLIASLATLVALAQITLHIHGRMTGINLVDYMQTDNTVMTMKEKLSFRSCSPSHRVLAGLMLLCQCFFYGGSLLCQCFFYGGSLALTRTFTKIIFSYARDGPGLSVLESSWMSSSFYVSSIVGMVLSLLPTSLIHIKYVMQTQSTILLTVCILMYFLHLNVTALWVLFISVGFFSGPLASSAFAMVNRYIEVTAVSQIIPQFGVAILDVIAMVAVGYYYEHDGPYSIWTILLITGLVIFIASVCMQIVAHMHGDRFTETRKGSSLDKK